MHGKGRENPESKKPMKASLAGDADACLVPIPVGA
jgi:hypothetical protein